MTDTQLILIGIATTGIFVSISLIAIMNSLENLVKEIRWRGLFFLLPKE